MKRRRLLKGAIASSVFFNSPLWAAPSNKYSVLIIGAGLSGLTSANILHEQGYNVLVLEARDRTGGRIHTIDHLPTKPDSGGLQIGLGYGAMRTYAQQMRLPLVSLGSYAKQTKFVIGNEIVAREAWPSHTSNKLLDSEKKTPPSSLYFSQLRKGPQFTLPSDWTKPEYAYLDISMHDYLKQNKVSGEALRLISANLNAISLHELSAADAFYRLSLALLGSRESHRVEGGNSRYTEALANKLPGKVLLGKAVSKITDNGTGVVIKCADGSAFEGKHCIVTTPFSTLRDIALDGHFSEGKVQAIKQAKYTPVTQVHFVLKKEVNKAEIEAVNLWSDRAFGRVFTQLDDQGYVQHLNSWINGNAAINLDSMPSKEAINTVQKSVERYFPSLANKITPVHHQSWANETYSKGAYIQFAPGQVQSLVPHMATKEGNLHFAGEHTEFMYSGMESAIISGMRAAQEIRDVLL